MRTPPGGGGGSAANEPRAGLAPTFLPPPPPAPAISAVSGDCARPCSRPPPEEPEPLMEVRAPWMMRCASEGEAGLPASLPPPPLCCASSRAAKGSCSW